MSYIILIIGLIVSPGFSDQEDNSSEAYVESIEGAESVRAQTPSGDVDLVPGDEVPARSVLRIPKGLTLRMAYVRGSHMTISPETEVAVDREGDIPFWELMNGYIFGSVDKSVDQSKDEKPKFIIRTKAAVVGVRGTEFAIESDGRGSLVHTLEGEVRVGKARQDLFTDQSRALPAGKNLTADNKGLSSNRDFSLNEYLKQMRARFPQLVAMRNRAIRRRQDLRGQRVDRRDERREQRRDRRDERRDTRRQQRGG